MMFAVHDALRRELAQVGPRREPPRR